MGFVRVGEASNYFGELELVAPEGFLDEGHMDALCERWGLGGYRECEYVRDGGGGA